MSKVTSGVDAAQRDEAHWTELRKESATMALYVAICLLAALSLVTSAEVNHAGTVVKIVWGTTIGLAAAHWFAFRLSARLVTAGAVRRVDGAIAAAQIAGAALVAVLATVPVVVFDGATELDAARLMLAGFIAVVGYVVAASSGAGVLRSMIYASTTLVVAVAIAVAKNVLAGH